MADVEWNPMQTPGHYISRIARAFARIGDARLRGLGIATAQLPVLTALKHGALLSQTELARWAKVEQPTMAQMLARMERDGLIRREPDPNDRRSSLIALTEQAHAKLPGVVWHYRLSPKRRKAKSDDISDTCKGLTGVSGS